VIHKNINKQMFTRKYGDVFKGDANWRKISMQAGLDLQMDDRLDLRAEPAVFRRHAETQPADRRHRRRSGVLGLFLDSITTDHISPAGSRSKRTARPGNILREHQVRPKGLSSVRQRGAAIIR